MLPDQLVQPDPLSDLLRQVHLRKRVQNLVDDLPNRLAGGSGTAVIESAATRNGRQGWSNGETGEAQ